MNRSMTRRRVRATVYRCVLAIFSVAGWTAAPAQTPSVLERAQAMMNTEHPGKAIYDKSCAACHNNPEATRSPGLESLKRMRYQAIYYALTQGKMQTQGATLSEEQRTSVIEFLVGREVVSDNWMDTMKCPANTKLDLKTAATVTTFGFDKQNHRHLTRAQAGLATADFANLELAWAVGFPGTTTLRSQAAVAGTTLFLPVADTAKVFAIDISGKPCLQWVYQGDAPLRTSAAFGELPGKRKVIVFGDLAANIHMVDAQTGKL